VTSLFQRAALSYPFPNSRRPKSMILSSHQMLIVAFLVACAVPSVRGLCSNSLHGGHCHSQARAAELRPVDGRCRPVSTSCICCGSFIVFLFHSLVCSWNAEPGRHRARVRRAPDRSDVFRDLPCTVQQRVVRNSAACGGDALVDIHCNFLVFCLCDLKSRLLRRCMVVCVWQGRHRHQQLAWNGWSKRCHLQSVRLDTDARLCPDRKLKADCWLASGLDVR
jgi:hypothetical protein